VTTTNKASAELDMLIDKIGKNKKQQMRAILKKTLEDELTKGTADLNELQQAKGLSIRST
jgi:hypothetical protein